MKNKINTFSKTKTFTIDGVTAIVCYDDNDRIVYRKNFDGLDEWFTYVDDSHVIIKSKEMDLMDDPNQVYDLNTEYNPRCNPQKVLETIPEYKEHGTPDDWTMILSDDDHVVYEYTSDLREFCLGIYTVYIEIYMDARIAITRNSESGTKYYDIETDVEYSKEEWR